MAILRSTAVLIVSMVTLSSSCIEGKAFSIPVGGDFEVCAESLRALIDKAFKLIESAEADPFNPSKDAIKEVFLPLQITLHECFNLDVDLVQYEVCIDDFMVLPRQLVKLYEDLIEVDWNALTLDLMGLQQTAEVRGERCRRRRNKLATAEINEPALEKQLRKFGLLTQ